MNITHSPSQLSLSLKPFSTQDTALHFAAADNPSAVPILLEYNADVNALDRYNWSPLLWAARYNQREAVIALCAAGANPHLGWSPLTSSSVSEEMKNLIREQLSL